ncbi:MAG: hypothetical protein H7138_09700 [Myxococcales bacterium]|nr:hypothetical protein [Myxococcales bacterium]
MAVVLIGMTSLVAAQPKPADNKMAPPPAAAKPADMKPADAKAGAMPEMKAPQEIADAAKAEVGSWNCKGQSMDRAMAMIPIIGKMKTTISADKWWLQTTFDTKMGKEPYHFDSYTTYDAAAKKWKRLMVQSGGSWLTGESAGMKDNKIVWDMTSHSPMGDGMFRDYEDLTDPKAGVKMWGEFSMDKGKTWTKVYEVACKK